MLPPNNICLTEVERRCAMNEVKDCIIVGDNFSDLHIIPTFTLETSNPGSKEIRLALDMVAQQYPLYKKASKQTKAEFVKDIFNYDVSIERIIRVKSFKEILFKKKIIKIKPIPNTKNRFRAITKKVKQT